MRIALFGQAAFGKDVLERVSDAGHEIVGVYAPPEGRRPDPLAEAAAERGLSLFRHKYFRRKGEARADRVAEHAALGAELNILAYVTAFIPVEMLDAPVHRSICFHPSLLPRFRGGAAIAWQIIEGESEAGVTVFQPDAGVDTGPIVVQKGGVAIGPEHTAGTLYYQQLYEVGVEAMCEAVEQIAAGTAEVRVQDEAAASFQGLVDDEVARIDWSLPAPKLDRLIRGCDPQPGAHALRGDEPVRLFDARLEAGSGPEAPGTLVALEGDRMWVAADGGRLSFRRARVGDGAKVAVAESGLEVGERLG